MNAPLPPLPTSSQPSPAALSRHRPHRPSWHSHSPPCPTHGWPVSPVLAQDPRPNPLRPQPPRPPNAWIIYRSEKLREMMQHRDPSKPKKPQALVSREISSMWKAEPPNVRAIYEQMADVQKSEHAKLYPGYRFQPMKKEEKARLREEKKAQKLREREAAKRTTSRHSAYPQPFLPMVHTPYYNPSLLGIYGPYGPSPPLSAASSPCSTPSPLSSSEDSSGQDPSTSFVPDTATNGQSSTYTSYTGVILPSTPVLPAQQLAVSSTSHPVDASFQHAWPTPATQERPSTSDVSNDMSAQAGPSNQWAFDVQTAPGPGVPDAQGMLSFDIPNVPELGWNMDDVNNAFLDVPMTATGSGSGVFQLSGFDPMSFMGDAPSHIDLSLGQMPSEVDQAQVEQEQFLQFLSSFDFSQYQGGDLLLTTAPAPEAEEIPSNTLSDFAPADEEGPFTADALLQFLNLDFVIPTNEAEEQAFSHPASEHSQSMPIVASSSSSSPYVPPSGAANAAIRRVAGSWKPAPGMTLPRSPTPIELMTPQLWAMNAN